MTDQAVSDASASKGRILVVDDEPDLVKILSRILRSAGFAVETVDTGQAAATRIETTSFDALLSDVSMPGMSGIDLLQLVQARDLELPVILLTGSPSIETAAHAVGLGAFRYLVKPIEPDALITAVSSAVHIGRLAKAKREALNLLADGGAGIGDHSALEQRFESALETVWMAFQPIVSVSKREVYAYEALVRCDEPTLPNPGALFDAAERLQRVGELGSVIRDRAAIAFKAAPPDVKLFVNLHTTDLNEASLYLPMAELSQMSRRVVLEITERASFDAVKNMRARVAVLRNLGFRVAIDDLGAGYAGLTSFAMLEPEVVKLDMSLVRDIQREPLKQRIVRSMVSLCRESGIMVVAEGIETAEERDALVMLGSDFMRGYLFARPSRPFPEVQW